MSFLSKYRDYLTYLLITLACILTTVIFFSNLFTRPNNLQEQKVDFSYASIDGDVSINDGVITVGKSGGKITFSDINLTTETITVSSISTREELFPASGTAGIKDSANSATFTNASGFLLSPGGNEQSATCSFTSKGEVLGIEIQFDEVENSYQIEEITLNQHESFRFGWIQFLITLIICIAIYLIVHNKWYRIVLDFNNKFHKRLLALSVAFCLYFALLVMSFMNVELFSTGADVSYNYYYNQFQSLQNGQIEIMIEPDDSLAQLENPYDRSLRNKESVNSEWDLSYYNGKYYSYFGLAPIFIVYYPVYWMTGQIPGAVLAGTILTLIAIVALSGALWEMLKKFEIRPNLLLYLLVSVTLPFGCLLYTCQVSASMYTTALICAIAFLALFIYLAFRATRERDKIRRGVLFALAGISFVIMVNSRPNYIILGIAGAAPLFIQVLRNKNESGSSCIKDAALFLAPVLIGGIAMMYYNYIRFDSPFDFGTAYQITVSDIRYNTVALSPVYLGEMIYSYFLMPIGRSFEFPFVNFGRSDIVSHGNYLFQYPSVGIMNYPIYWFSLLTGKISSKMQPVKTATMWLLVASALILAYINFCVGGVIYRYSCDIMVPLILVSAIVVLEIFSGSRADKGGWLYVTACAICLATIVIGFFCIFSNEANNIYSLNTDFYIQVSKIFSFG